MNEPIMMSFENFIKDYLVQNGMFENQADETMQMIKDSKANEPMKDRWNDSVDHYPPAMKAIAILSAKKSALEYIDKNCPKAWFRDMFIA